MVFTRLQRHLVGVLAHVEQAGPDNGATIDKLNRTFDRILQTVTDYSGHAVKSVHAKSHALPEGTLTVDAGLPPELVQGPFAKPSEHKVYMRLSTNAGNILPDAVSP